jgi:hypothetical protein
VKSPKKFWLRLRDKLWEAVAVATDEHNSNAAVDNNELIAQIRAVAAILNSWDKDACDELWKGICRQCASNANVSPEQAAAVLAAAGRNAYGHHGLVDALVIVLRHYGLRAKAAEILLGSEPW